GTAGAPRSQVPAATGWSSRVASNRMADQRSAEENATSSATGRDGPGNAAARACVVAFGADVLRATAATIRSRSPALTSRVSAWIAPKVILWVVRVPVLSLQNVSIRLIASIAL